MYTKNIILAVTLIAIGGAIYFINSQTASHSTSAPVETIMPRAEAPTPDTNMLNSETTKADTAPVVKNAQTTNKMSYMSQAEKAKKYQLAKEITTPDGFINTDGKSIKIADYIGKKVIIVDFLTYSCINCQRTLPYLNSWYTKYESKGLVIIGVHTPEFEFEKNYDNVKAAVEKFGIKFPIVLDNDFSTWNAYQNRYWPHKYLVDIDGYIVYDHIGEGSYEETEAKIQDLLKERMSVLGISGSIDSSLTKEFPLTGGAMSPETYFGSLRNVSLANGASNSTGVQNLTEPLTILPSKLYLLGQWNIVPEYAESGVDVGTPSVGSNRIDYRYQAKNVYFVAGSKTSMDVEVLRDSKPIDASVKGKDVFYKNGKSYITVSNNRLYSIIEDSSTGDHLLEFIISSPGLQAFTFTFG